MVNKINEDQTPKTKLMIIFEEQMNPDFPISIKEDMKPTFNGFKRLDTFIVPPIWCGTPYYQFSEESDWGDSFFRIYAEVDEPIKKAIQYIIDNESGDHGYFFSAHGAGEYGLYQSSLTKKTSDLTRYYADLVQISSIRDILALLHHCSENWGEQHTPFKYFLPILRKTRNSKNLDLGYCYLFDENGKKALYVIWIEFFSGYRHLHCLKVPRRYKPKRHFLVKLRE